MFLNRRLPQLFSYTIRRQTYNPNINSSLVFHKSSPSQAPIPFLAAFIVKGFVKFGAFVTGRTARKWWKALPKEKKSAFLKQHKVKFQILAGGTTFSLSAFYYNHLEYTPITKRLRFMYYSPEDIETVVNINVEELAEKHNNSFLSQYHPQQQCVNRIFKRIYERNKDISQMVEINWKIIVVDSPIQNAFSLPDGHIYIYTGMLNSFKNEDQLAGILSHEMAHVILKHGCEQVNRMQYFDTIKIGLIGLIWLFIPYDSLAAFSHYLMNIGKNVLLDNSYSRKLEMEADEVGLLLTSKACFDSREVIIYWKDQSFENEEIPDFVSTHPSSQKRFENLDHILPKMLDLRQACGCSDLKDTIILRPRFVPHLTSNKTL